MKPVVVGCATMIVFAGFACVSSSAMAEKPKKKPAKKVMVEEETKVAPPTEAATPRPPEPASPIPLDVLPPPSAPSTTPSSTPATTTPDVAKPTHDSESAADDTSNSSTRVDAIVGRTQTLGFALGFRAGHRTANNTYVGGTAMMFTDVGGGVLAYPALELGYDAKLGSARFMPFAGAGAMLAIPTGDNKADPKVSPLVYPGFALRYENDKSVLTAGADVRFLYLTATDVTAFSFNLTTGIRF